MSEGLSSVMYRASFGEDTSNLKNLQATVTSLHPSSQVKIGPTISVTSVTGSVNNIDFFAFF